MKVTIIIEHNDDYEISVKFDDESPIKKYLSPNQTFIDAWKQVIYIINKRIYSSNIS